MKQGEQNNNKDENNSGPGWVNYLGWECSLPLPLRQ